MAAQWTRAAQRRLLLLTTLWTVAALLGALHSWKFREAMNPDGISYLDMADAWSRSGWRAMINGYFSPLYAILLGAGLKVLSPPPYHEFPAVHAVNFAIYLLTLACFHFFLSGMIQRLRKVEGGNPLPEWIWLTAGYGLFIWSSLYLIRIELVNPDMLASGILYLGAGALLRMPSAGPAWRASFLLGVILGLGYLTKTVLFPIAFVFLIAAALTAGSFRRGVQVVLTALLVFLAIASPWIVAISRSRGFFTIGESSKLAYPMMVNEYPIIHWRGEPPGSGVPAHPTRKLLDDPAVYEFGSPIRGTYPPWYDPAWWNLGMKPAFSLRRELSVILRHLIAYLGRFVIDDGFLLAAAVALWRMGGRQWPDRSRRAIICATLIPAVTGLGLYALVWVEWRYLGGFLLLFWMGVLALASGNIAPDHRKIPEYIGAGVVAVIVLRLVWSAYTIMEVPAREPEARRVAVALNEMGVRPGSPVAVIGNSHLAFWARLARVRITAEIPEDLWDWEIRQPHPNDVDRFWQADAAAKARVMDVFAATGAEAVITKPPFTEIARGWRRLGNTDYYAYLFKRGPEVSRKE